MISGFGLGLALVRLAMRARPSPRVAPAVATIATADDGPAEELPTQPGAVAPAFPRGPDFMGYFGKPEIVGLRAIEPRIQVAISSTVEPVTLRASAAPTRWTRDAKPGERPGEFEPWSSLEFRWTLLRRDDDTGDLAPYDPGRRYWLANPVPHLNGLGDLVNPATDQIGPEFAVQIRDPGTYVLRLDARGMDENGRMVAASTTSHARPSQYFLAASLPGKTGLTEANTSGSITLTVTIPDDPRLAGTGITPGAHVQAFDIYQSGLDVKAWLESVCGGAGNVLFEGGTISDYQSLANVQVMPPGTPHPWPILNEYGGSYFILFGGDLHGLPVELSVSNAVSTPVGYALGYFAWRFPYMTGTAAETITVAPFAGSKRYYDSNYDGSNGPSDGSIARPWTALDHSFRYSGSNTTCYLKRGSAFRLYPAAGVAGVCFEWFDGLTGARWRDYGDEEDPRPVLGIYGGDSEGVMIRITSSHGQSFSDLVVDGLCFEAWNPDPAINRGVSRGEGPCRIYNRLLGRVNGTAIPSWSHGVTFSYCTFRWNTHNRPDVVWALSEGDKFSPLWAKIGNEFLMARGREALIGGGAPYQTLMGNRYHGGGVAVTFYNHQIYESVASHGFCRFEAHENVGIDGLPYVGGTAHKITPYISCDGILTDYYMLADCRTHGFSSGPVFGFTKNLQTGLVSVVGIKRGIFERLHVHRPGLCTADGVANWISFGQTLAFTVRDSHFTRTGLGPSGGRAASSASPALPGSFTNFYRNRMLEAANTNVPSINGHMVEFGTDDGGGAYVADNVIVKETGVANGVFSIRTAAIGNLRMRRNRYYTKHPSQLCALNAQVDCYSLAQMQASGLEAGSSVAPLESFEPADPGTDERLTLMWPAGAQRGKVVRLGGAVVRVGH